MNIKRTQLISFCFIITGIITGLAFTIYLLWPLIIPDQCYYDIHETNWFIELFFNFPAYEGYHPVPSLFNLLLFGYLGGIGGNKIGKTVLKH